MLVQDGDGRGVAVTVGLQPAELLARDPEHDVLGAELLAKEYLKKINTCVKNRRNRAFFGSSSSGVHLNRSNLQDGLQVSRSIFTRKYRFIVTFESANLTGEAHSGEA